MTDGIRYNKAIDLLEQGKTVFASGLVWNGNLDDLTFIADSDYDMVMIEMEHEGFSLNDLRVSLQFLLNRRRIAEKGNVQPDVVPLVRIPPNSRERNSKLWTPACLGWCYRFEQLKRRRQRWWQPGIPRFPESQISSRSAKEVGGSGSRLGIGALVPKSITMLPICGHWIPMGTCCLWALLRNRRV